MSSYSENEDPTGAIRKAEEILRKSRKKELSSDQPEGKITPENQEQASVREAMEIFIDTQKGRFSQREAKRKEEQTIVSFEGGKEMLKIASGFMRIASKAERLWRENKKKLSNKKFIANPRIVENYTSGEESYDMQISKGDVTDDMFSYYVFAATNGVPTLRAAVRFFGRPPLTFLEVLAGYSFEDKRETVSSGDAVIAVDIFHTKYALDFLRESNYSDAFTEMSSRIPDGINQLDALNAPMATFFISPKGIGKTVHTPAGFTPSQGQKLTPHAHEWHTYPSKISPSDVTLLQGVLTASKKPIGL